MCERCQGRGFVRLPPSARYPYGSETPCDCRVREQRRRRLQSLMARSGLDGETLRRWSFATLDPNAAVAGAQGRATLAQVLAHCIAYAQSPRGWLVLCGPYGCGKSHLAYATAGACLRAGHTVFVSTVPDLLGALRQGYGEPQGTEGRRHLSFDQRLALVCDAELVVLYDLGAEHHTPWGDEKLYQLVDYRHRRRLPAIVTTNVNLHDPGEAIAPRVLSRLLDGANLQNGFSRVYLIAAGDYRQRVR